MHTVRASTSSGSTAGNIPTRSWLRPSLRYGSTSTTPLARSTAATDAASTSSVKSIVPTTSERAEGSATKGEVYAVASAHAYSRLELSVVRFTAQSRPPWSLIQLIWLDSSASVETAGVL